MICQHAVPERFEHGCHRSGAALSLRSHGNSFMNILFPKGIHSIIIGLPGQHRRVNLNRAIYRHMGEPTLELRPKILLLGDSITQWAFRPGGWGNLLAQHYMRRADVVNRGFSGYNSSWILQAVNKVGLRYLQRLQCCLSVIWSRV